jgi:2',3'-cyclic-nucleotide 2'-phosphodiesterase/3'-nucleotidase/5'-nucleotidase
LKKTTSMRFFILSLVILLPLLGSAQGLNFERTYTYKTDKFNQGGTEINAYEPLSQRIFSTNAAENKIDILKIGDLRKSYRVSRIDLSLYSGTVNSLAVQGNVLAVALEANLPQSNGKVVFFDTNGTYINQVVVGAMPDMICFTPSLQYILVANEGEPSDDYFSDPLGSVSIIDFRSGSASTLTQADVHSVDFTRYDTIPYDPSINIYGNNGLSSFSQDVEPEYIAVDPTSTKAYVSLQENNALAVIDIFTFTLDTVLGLGYKDHNLIGSGFDASDSSSSINIKPHFNVFGMYQPDAIKAFSKNGSTYLASANEGDARTYTGYSEVERIKNVNLNPIIFNSPSTLQLDSVLGRLKISTTLGNKRNGFVHDSLFTFGARSFSIWDDQGQLVWDSGDDFEQISAQAYAANFNSNNDNNTSGKNRSDDKGPEPEALAIGEVDGVLYAFIGLERMGGIMIYNIDNPTAPTFDSYILYRNFSVPASDTAAGDLGPEHITFIPSQDSPNGVALLAISNEVSGSLSIYQIGLAIGIDELAENKKIELYPNPSSGIFKLSEKQSLKIYNSHGNLIKEVQNESEIDLSNEASGFYTIINEAGNSLKVIKK